MENWKIIQRKSAGGYRSNSRDVGTASREGSRSTTKQGKQTELKRHGNQMVRQFFKKEDQEALKEIQQDDLVEAAMKKFLALPSDDDITQAWREIEMADHLDASRIRENHHELLQLELSQLTLHSKTILTIYEVVENRYGERTTHGAFLSKEKAERVMSILEALEKEFSDPIYGPFFSVKARSVI